MLSLLLPLPNSKSQTREPWEKIVQEKCVKFLNECFRVESQWFPNAFMIFECVLPSLSLLSKSDAFNSMNSGIKIQSCPTKALSPYPTVLEPNLMLETREYIHLPFGASPPPSTTTPSNPRDFWITFSLSLLSPSAQLLGAAELVYYLLKFPLHYDPSVSKFLFSTYFTQSQNLSFTS